MAWVKKHLLPTNTFMHATVTTIVTICNNHISLKNDTQYDHFGHFYNRSKMCKKQSENDKKTI